MRKIAGTTVRKTVGRQSMTSGKAPARRHEVRGGPTGSPTRRRVRAAGWARGSEASWRRSRPRQVPDSHQVVHGQGEGEHPPDPAHASMAHLATQSHRLGPAEDLFPPLALLLTDDVAGMARRARINGTAPAGGVLGHMRGELLRPQRRD